MWLKLCFIFSLIFSIPSQSADNWRKISHSLKSCLENYEVYAKEGEKFLRLKFKNQIVELKSVDLEKFTEESPQQQRYSSLQNDFEYIQPSVIDGNLPRLIIKNENHEICKMVSTKN